MHADTHQDLAAVNVYYDGNSERESDCRYYIQMHTYLGVCENSKQFETECLCVTFMLLNIS